MNDIVKKQSSEYGIKIGAAFRYAYNRAKFWKLWIWGLTLLLAVLQLLAATNHQHLMMYLRDNIAAMVITVSLLTMLMSILGRYCLVNKFVGQGSKLQRLHDFEILGLGTKPTVLEVKPSQVELYSQRWLDTNPHDRSNLSEWWPNSVEQLPENTGISLCLLSTFKWENELRNKYSNVLIGIILLILFGSLLLMHILDYLIADYIVKIFVPLSPLLGLLIDEWLVNRSGINTASSSSREALRLWDKFNSNSVDENSGKNELNQLSYLWGSYRSSVSPIFDWLYWITQKTMNRDMIIDADKLVMEYQNKTE